MAGKVLILMGSKADAEGMGEAARVLSGFGIPYTLTGESGRRPRGDHGERENGGTERRIPRRADPRPVVPRPPGEDPGAQTPDGRGGRGLGRRGPMIALSPEGFPCFFREGGPPGA